MLAYVLNNICCNSENRIYSFSFDSVSLVITLIGILVTLIVLFLTKKDVSYLRKHQSQLSKHEELLRKVRPLYSTLMTDGKDIMRLAIKSTQEANELYNIGNISSLVFTEKKHDENEEDFKIREAKAKEETKNYIRAITDLILKGKKYQRILNFLPNKNNDNLDEIYANVSFFFSLMNVNSYTKDLQLYHNHEILNEKGDYHFRCSDKEVIIRIGGHGNTSTNAAIIIKDTNVM